MRRRWAATRRRSRRSSSPSLRMPSSRSCRRRSAGSITRWRRRNYHHEIELVVAIGARGSRLAPAAALAIVWGYAVGLDMTRRDLQAEMREKKRPWDIGKSFAEAAPIGPIHPVAAVGHPAAGRIWLDVNGAHRQQGDLSRDDLGRRAHDPLPFAILRAPARRPHLHRDARGRGGGRRRAIASTAASTAWARWRSRSHLPPRSV